MSTALALMTEMTAVEIFNGKNVDSVLEGIKSKARAEAAKLDISTPAGREAIASLAHTVARTKTGLDEEGKSLVEGEKKKLALVDAARKRYRDELDDLKAEIRKPLTDWENAEKSRVAGHETALDEMLALARLPHFYTVADAENAILSLKGYSERDWEEFDFRAKRDMQESFTKLKEALQSARRAEEERIELDRLRKEQIEREQRERDERIAREAAERERKLAETREQEAARAAEAERQRIEFERNQAEAKAKQAEAQRIADAEAAHEARIAAEQKAVADQEAAVLAERKRIEDEQRKEREAAEARENNKRHVSKINGEIALALVEHGVSEDAALAAVKAIAAGLVPHVKIAY